MRRTIADSEMRTLNEILNEWQQAKEIEASCLADVCELMDCTEDQAVDVLNNVERVGLEVYQDDTDDQHIDPMVYMYGDMLGADWVLVAIFGGCIGCVVLAAYFIWGLR